MGESAIKKENMPVEINGVKYQSYYTAAKELGIPISTLRSRINAGYVGDDLLKSHISMSCDKADFVIDGVQYNTLSEIANAYDVPVSTLYVRFRKGDRGAALVRKSNFPSKSSGSARPVTINGVTYASTTEAAKALNINYQTLISRLNHGFDDERLSSQKLRQHKSIPIMYDGVEYKSEKDLCAMLGLDLKHVQHVKRRNKLSTELAIKHILERKQRQSITYEGITYNSLGALCNHFGVEEARIRGRLMRGWSLEDAINTTVESAAKRRRGIPVSFLGKSYETLGECLSEYQLDAQRVRDLRKAGLSAEKAIETDAIRRWGTIENAIINRKLPKV